MNTQRNIGENDWKKNVDDREVKTLGLKRWRNEDGRR
jgi:hypothetical protein